MTEERRRYTRLPIPDQTLAVDDAGLTLGRVTLAGGGGIQLEDITAEGERQLQPGRRLRLTVLEPAINARHTAEVEVVYRNGSRAGLRFVAAKSAGA
jgi:hypothetical protein